MDKSDLHGLIDYHTHTAVTVDSDAKVDACCRSASDRGLAELAFTNHMILGNPDYCMSPTGMQDLCRQIEESQKRYPGLTIRLGAEVDYFEGREAEIAAMLQRYEEIAGRPFDFVMGAVHYLRGVFYSSPMHAPDLFTPPGRDARMDGDGFIDSLYTEYFAQISKAVRSGLFNTIAHIDLIKKYSDQLSPRLPFARYRDAVEEVVRVLVESQVGIEVNTKGLTTTVGEFYPSQDFLTLYVEQAKAQGTRPIITIGADSHQAVNVGNLVEEGARAIVQAGCTELTGFHLRKSYPIQIQLIPNSGL